MLSPTLLRSSRSMFVCTFAGLAAVLPAQASDQDHAKDNVFGQMHWRELGPVMSGGRIVDIAVYKVSGVRRFGSKPWAEFQ